MLLQFITFHWLINFVMKIVLLQQGKLLAVGETKAVLNADNLDKAFHIRAEIDPLKRLSQN